ncbi:hypothetical protein [Photobacterium damselae]|uniref:hypothetical protein n=1 Tax=Photobacterium damselae TaxID=38293 RepID=UPI001302E5B9|nr:hypothetical protein [Photobacterium damselae]
MKKQLLVLSLLALTSTSYANVTDPDALEAICSVQGGMMTNITEGGARMEFLTDANNITHKRFYAIKSGINLDLAEISDDVKELLVDAVKHDLSLEACMTPEDKILSGMMRISTNHK